MSEYDRIVAALYVQAGVERERARMWMEVMEGARRVPPGKGLWRIAREWRDHFRARMGAYREAARCLERFR